MRSGTNISFGSKAKGLEPAMDLEPTAKSDVQEVNVRK